MVDQRAMFRVTQQYARTILGTYEIGHVLDRLSDDITAVLGVDGAGVSIGDQQGHLQWVAATDSTVADLERRQVEVGEGPCHEAYKTGMFVQCDDVDQEGRWPAYIDYLRGHGWKAVAGIPMFAGDECIGAVNAYNGRPRHWTAEELEAGRVLADMASGYIVNAIRYDERERRVAHLQHALESRIVIEQAKGALSERRGITPDEAFDIIRRYARTNRQKIHDVAREVLSGPGALDIE